MTSVLTLTSQNWNSDQKAFVLPFLSASYFGGFEMALAPQIYNCFNNVSALYPLNNNNIKIRVPSGETFVEYSYTVPNGFYTLKTFSIWLKTKMDEDKLYYIGSKGEKLYLLEFSTQINGFTQLLRRSIGSSLVIPSGATYVNITQTGKFRFVDIQWSLKLAQLFGFTGNVGNNATESDVSDRIFQLIDYAPNYNQPQPISTINFKSNLLRPGFSNLSILNSIPINQSYGASMRDTSFRYKWCECSPSFSNELIIQLYSQENELLNVYDTNVCLVVFLRKKE